jgi:DNA polymerase iota
MRVIIHLDFDFFYGQVEQLLKPHLTQVPFAIQQKHIVVTCNYVARALGVSKLMLLTKAKEICPQLLVINGEDITKYRRMAKKVWQFVNDVLNGPEATSKPAHQTTTHTEPSLPIQRLGMDEYFIDATNVVVKHLESLNQKTGDGKIVQFSLGESGPVLFEYKEGAWEGHIYHPLTAKPEEAPVTSQETNQLQVACHLASFIRRRILKEFKLTCSAGISTSKLLSKLISGYRKPNDQTVLFSSYAYNYLSNLSLSQIPGFGHRTRRLIQDKWRELELERIPDLRDIPEEWKENQITVDMLRKRVQKAEFVGWIQTHHALTAATQLYDLLLGIDASPVLHSKPSSQISVEDSFLGCAGWEALRKTLYPLVGLFLDRLIEEECDSSLDARSNNSHIWLRIPKTLRLTLRHKGNKHSNRESRSCSFPVSICRPDVSKEDKVKVNIHIPKSL